MSQQMYCSTQFFFEKKRPQNAIEDLAVYAGRARPRKLRPLAQCQTGQCWLSSCCESSCLISRNSTRARRASTSMSTTHQRSSRPDFKNAHGQFYRSKALEAAEKLCPVTPRLSEGGSATKDTEAAVSKVRVWRSGSTWRPYTCVGVLQNWRLRGRAWRLCCSRHWHEVQTSRSKLYPPLWSACRACTEWSSASSERNRGGTTRDRSSNSWVRGH